MIQPVDGTLRGVAGIAPMVAAMPDVISVVAIAGFREAQGVAGARVRVASTLREVVDALNAEAAWPRPPEGEARDESTGRGWAALSLGSPCVMICEHPGRRLAVPVLLSPGGLLTHRVGAGSAWQTHVPGRKIARFGGPGFSRGSTLGVMDAESRYSSRDSSAAVAYLPLASISRMLPCAWVMS